MNEPLPHESADKLMAHLGTCNQCRISKDFPSEPKCVNGQNRIRETMNARHGETSDS